MNNKPPQTAEEIGQLFENNFDCYADVNDESSDISGKIIMAMTKEKFIEVVSANTSNADVISELEKLYNEFEPSIYFDDMTFKLKEIISNHKQ